MDCMHAILVLPSLAIYCPNMKEAFLWQRLMLKLRMIQLVSFRFLQISLTDC